MCGIAVSIGFLDSTIEAAVERMSAAQRHRGPDARGVWRSTPAAGDRGVMLAHRRLSIVDLSDAAGQPMHDDETGNVLVFNGEIYGFTELRAELVSLGTRFRTASDTEVLLRAYAVHGADCLHRLRGMFAFALYDATRKVLFIARDRLGIKPLYFSRVVGKRGQATLLIASEVRALLASGCIDRRLSPSALATYAWNGFVNADEALVLGVFELPSGHWAEVSLEGELPKSRPYWQMPLAAGPGRDDLDEVRSELERATSQHLVSDVPMGVFLSGGVDSSAVAALATRVGCGQIATFTITFDDPAFDESIYARRVAGALRTQHVEIRLTESTFAAQLGDAFGGIDQPSFDGLNTYFVSRAVRESGITVALAGTGGDEILGGYRSFQEIPRVRSVAQIGRHAPRRLVSLLSRLVARAVMGRSLSVPPQTRWGKVEDVLTSGSELVDLYQVYYGLFSRRFFEDLLDPEIIGQTRFGLTPSRRAALVQRTHGIAPLRAIAALEMSNFLEKRLLRDTDAASMAVSLEVRVPLLDHLVIEATARLSDAKRFLPLGRKQLLRDVALLDLEPAIFERPKSGFVLPIEKWARGILQRDIVDTLHDSQACRSVGLAPGAVSLLWRAFEARAPGVYWSRIWSVYTLLRWCRTHSVSLSGVGRH